MIVKENLPAHTLCCQKVPKKTFLRGLKCVGRKEANITLASGLLKFR